MFPDAIKAAQQADVVVMVMGISTTVEGYVRRCICHSKLVCGPAIVFLVQWNLFKMTTVLGSHLP